MSCLRSKDDIEVVVHVDGSKDDTYNRLGAIRDARLSISVDSNKGRAFALYNAVKNASGKYVMLFDDDDWIDPEGIRAVISDCEGEALRENRVGFIYHLSDSAGKIVGTNFDVEISNFIELRADHNLQGDKKEVVLASVLKEAFEEPLDRRVPTSLYWSRIALKYDVICRNKVIGRKNYLTDGMTSNILSLKMKNPYSMALLYITRVKGFLLGRYRSFKYFFKSLLLWLLYRVKVLFYRCS
jgi:glycosyltransferase involved in cell wall biosynthesis